MANRFKSKRQREAFFGTYGRKEISREEFANMKLDDSNTDADSRKNLLKIQDSVKTELYNERKEKERELKKLKESMAMKIVLNHIRKDSSVLNALADKRIQPDQVISHYRRKHNE